MSLLEVLVLDAVVLGAILFCRNDLVLKLPKCKVEMMNSSEIQRIYILIKCHVSFVLLILDWT